MDVRDVQSAEQMRRRIEDAAHVPLAFRDALLAVSVVSRDAWVDRVLGLGEPPNDGPELPRGGVPYVPCDVAALLEVIERAQITPDDVFVDIGAGVGRATALVHLLTGAATVGIEIQPDLSRVAGMVARPLAGRMTHVTGDAATVIDTITHGSVFFLYCPFSDDRLHQVLASLEALARARPIRVCCVDLPLPACAWLTALPTASERVSVFRGGDASRSPA